MTDQSHYIAAVIANPGDDSPRLAYADWLDERGAYRGEFIRSQVALARSGACGHLPPRRGCESCRLRERACKLLRKFHDDWAPWADGGWEVWADGTKVYQPSHLDPMVNFRRGFVAAVACDCATFLGLAADIFRDNPVELVTLTDRSPNRDAGPAVGFTHLPLPADDPFDVGQHPRPRYWAPSDPPHVLPWPLHDCVTHSRSKNVAGCDSDCTAWLERACLRYGRAAARGKEWWEV